MNDLATFARLQFNIVHQGTQMDQTQRQGISGFHFSIFSRFYGIAQVETQRSKYIPFFPVTVVNQGDSS
jgi:hypothetical protein